MGTLIAQYARVTDLTIVLIGHSMGGIIGTESILSSLSNTPGSLIDGSGLPAISIVPYIEGILAFDTPYLGIAPSALVHGVDVPYQFARDLYQQPKTPMDAKAGSDGGRFLMWKQWVIHIMGGLFVAGSAYLARSVLKSGLEEVGSHLVFVESLARRVELRSRLEHMMTAAKEHRIGFVDLFVVLGEWSGCDNVTVMDKVARGEMRSFCEIPQAGDLATAFLPVENSIASNEITAHMSMFERQKNSGYGDLVTKAAILISSWVQR